MLFNDGTRPSWSTLYCWFTLSLSLSLCINQGKADDTGDRRLDVVMPPYAVPGGEELYLCTAVPLPPEPMKLVGIEPTSSQQVVHHMLLFGCDEPGSGDPVWTCHMSGPCSGSETVLYGWGKDAEAMQLPEGVGFGVGHGTAIKQLVLQIHYLHGRPDGDKSGVRLSLSAAPVPFSAGMLMYASGFTIPPGQNSTLISNRFCYSGFEDLRGFAFRVHTHSMGRLVYLDEVNEKGLRSRLAEQSPQLPQAFYPVDPARMRFLPGTSLEATCDFDSSQHTQAVYAGSTHNDEMCNWYQMVYSQYPFFITSVNGKARPSPHGPGGIPADSTLQPESSGLWNPPTDVNGTAVGQVSAVARGANGTLWVFHRGERIWDGASFDGGGAGERLVNGTRLAGPMLLRLEQDTGRLLGSMGAGMFLMPHGLMEDWDGSVWVTDVGLHQAIKLSPAGERLLELGVAGEPGHDAAHFCKPTQVAVGADGSVYVADGYCNARVMQFTAAGAFVREFRLPEGGPQLRVPHALLVDDCGGALLVADREAAAVHSFQLQSGELLGSWSLTEYGPVYGLKTGPYGHPLALCWQRDAGEDGPTSLVWLDRDSPGAVLKAWQVPGVHAPHDLALAVAPTELTGSRARLLSVLVGETRPAGSRLLKFTIVPEGVQLLEVAAEAVGVRQRTVNLEGDGQRGEARQAAQDAPSELEAEMEEGFVEASRARQGEAERGGGGVSEEVLARHKEEAVAEKRPRDAGRLTGQHGDRDPLRAAQQQLQEDLEFSEAVKQMLLLGLPFAVAFGVFALVLWRRLGDMAPLPTEEEELPR